jgi:2-polyprenyl-3-methyl-5-hydroxy-6-metoxy-1,4-benzoquinol methylase
VARALAAKKGGPPLDIALLTGGLRRRGADAAPPGVRLLEPIPQLGEHLAEYDLLITHYGITAFEALRARIPVLLVSPTAYHEKLARAAGFYSAGPGNTGAARAARLLRKSGERGRAFIRYLQSRCAACAVRHGLDREPGQSLAELISSFTPLAVRRCPVCGAPLSGPVRGRGPDRSFRRCGACGALGMIRLSPPPVEYEREYFFTFYQKQYGKTYIEDFPHLIAMGKRRLGVIKSLLPPGSGGLLLDIGCAYGPFLAAAREAGFSPCGIDPAEDAVRYVTERLGMPAVQGFFPGCPPPPAAGENGSAPRFDVISLWYVIEHFRDCVPVFAEIRRLLKPGGVLAFSTPSYTGISGRSSFGRFLAGSPADHWSVWSPGVCKKALALAGFKVQRIISTGHHPERFPLPGAWTRGPLYRLLLAASTLFALGDTFEVYARADEYTDI